MADTENTDGKKRRIIRKAETVREKAEKSAGAAKPKDGGIFRLTLHYIAVPFRAAGRALAKLERFKPFRIIGLILVPPYFRNSFKELQGVTWPNRRDSIRLTFAVLMFAIVLTILVTAVDFGLDKVFKRILLNE